MQIFDTIDSTQIEAKRQIDIKQLIIEDAILAMEQTAGISTKKGVPWISQRGDLTISLILNIEVLLKNGFILINHIPFCVSLAMFDELYLVKQQSKRNFDILLKWPNDFLITRGDNEYRKIGGVMCNNYKGHFIVGFTCNLVNFQRQTCHFPSTDLFIESGIKLDCVKLAQRLLEKIKQNIEQIQTYGFIGIKDKWKKHAYMIGKKLILKDNEEVIFEDITDEGYILAKKTDGIAKIIISSDEVIGGEGKIYKNGKAESFNF